MKKLLISLLLLTLVAGAVFIIGWLQLYIDDDEAVVVFTKTHGWEPEVLYPGKFSWYWQAMFPTVLTRYHYKDIQQELDFELRTSLPGSELYSSYVPGSPSFFLRVSGNYRYRIDPAHLPLLSETRGLRPDKMDDFHASLTAELESRILEAIQSSILRNAQTDEFAGIGSTLELETVEQLAEEYPYLDTVAFTISSLELPDLELYSIARSRYRSLLEAETQGRESAGRELARIELISRAQEESLERLGTLFDAHPSLIEYLSLVAETGSDPLGLSGIFRSVFVPGAAQEVLLPASSDPTAAP